MVVASSCGACRHNKKRCDRAEPECGQCRRLGRKCPGYRDSTSLVFRNATPGSIGRNVRRKEEVTVAPLSPPSDSVSPAATSTSSNKGEQDAGVKHFLAHYAVPETETPMGLGDHVVKLLKQREDDNGPFYAAVEAVGLAGMATTRDDKALLKKARTCYGDALQKLKATVSDPTERNKDSTVIASLVLGIYESITCAEDDPLDSWSAHIDGAASIIISRGAAQFSTPRGLEIFQLAVSHMMVRCLRVRRPLPAAIRVLRAQAAPLIKPDDMLWTMSSGHIEALDLVLAPHPVPDPEGMLVRALEIDARIAALMAAPPPGWSYLAMRDPAADPRLVHAGLYHVYPALLVAKIWAGLRLCRIMLAKLALRLLRQTGAYPEQAELARARLAAMRDGVVASVPQLLGFVRRNAAGDGFDVGEPEGGEADSSAALGSFFLLWYLFTVARLEVTSDATRAWLVGRLRVIKAMTGMAKADFLANVLEREIRHGGETEEGKQVEERGVTLELTAGGVSLEVMNGDWKKMFK